VVAPDGQGGVCVGWQDARAAEGCGADSCVDIYAQRLATDGPVPALADLVASELAPGRVRLIWSLNGDARDRVRIDRATRAGDWFALGVADPDGSGRVEFVDRDVVAGQRYGYRLAVRDGAREHIAGETWVTVPELSAFGLLGPRPNPALDELRVVFSLPGAGPALLDLLDVAGRRVLSREVGDLGGGTHEVSLGSVARLPAGVYLVRLTRGSLAASARAVLFHR
jgi:hypothetical protein